MIPKDIADAAAARRFELEHCPRCREPLDEGGVHVDGETVHVRCVDWSTRDYPGRDLVRRIRAQRRALAELDRGLAAAEDVAIKLERGAHRWPQQAAIRYFRLVDRLRRASWKATGSW